MATNITWTDGIGAATLNNGKPVPGDRFANWHPAGSFLGAEEEALGTGQLYTFSFRDEYLVSFELRAIPASQMALMLRLNRHLKKGGTVSVNTGDASSHVYATCCLQKGADPSPKLSDPKNVEYTMSFALRNVAGSPVDFILQY